MRTSRCRYIIVCIYSNTDKLLFLEKGLFLFFLIKIINLVVMYLCNLKTCNERVGIRLKQ